MSVAPAREVAEVIREEGGDVLKLCYQCGMCTATCPWNKVRSFPIRQIIHQAQLGLADFASDDMWLCVMAWSPLLRLTGSAAEEPLTFTPPAPVCSMVQ